MPNPLGGGAGRHLRPPVGDRSAALGAIVFSLLTSAMWGLVLFGRT